MTKNQAGFATVFHQLLTTTNETETIFFLVFITNVDVFVFRTNVVTKYEAYYVKEGTSQLRYYYVSVCKKTCGLHVVFCWKKKRVCTYVYNLVPYARSK